MKQVLLAILLFVNVIVLSQTGIGTTTPEQSAQLDVSSNDKGFLTPRMTASQRDNIENPAQGLIIFCTDCASGEGELQIRLTSSWKSLDLGDVNDPAGPTGGGVTFNGYTYTSIVLGNGQEWMAENLRTTTYANGDPIPNVTDANQWENLTTGAWAHYNNDSQYENPYGKLYNWYTVNDPRNVCPTGWHVPTDAEWTVLIDYLGGESVAGGKMKSTGTQYWLYPNTDATNESGFSGLPGGFRNGNGTFLGIGDFGYWWSSTEDGTYFAWDRALDYSSGGVSRGNVYKESGFSVRCLRD